MTNAADAPRTWHGPDQVALRYPASDGERSREYIKSADESGATRKAMLTDINTLIKEAKLSAEVVKLVKESTGNA